MKVLVINSGSSSLKYQLIETDTKEVLAKGNFERIGQKESFLTHKVNGEKYEYKIYAKNHEVALNSILEKLTDKKIGVIKSFDEIDAVGHRVVNGGDKLTETKFFTDDVIAELKRCVNYAPLHNPAAIIGVEAVKQILPNTPNVACFDTSFHQTMKPEQYLYPIPYKYYEKYGIRKYGAHGISHEYILNRISELKGVDKKALKIINCHLGQGCSLCAIKDGKCVDTSMGLTPLGGIPMGTRSGDLDPSVVTFIMKLENKTPEEMEDILNHESGVYGVSCVSSDFRDVEEEVKNGNEKADLAMKMFFYLVAQRAAEYMVTLGGCDVITFTAGVGEKGREDRLEICKLLKPFGVDIDEELNNQKGYEGKISSEKSKIEVWVVPTNEELQIANETERLVKESKKSK